MMIALNIGKFIVIYCSNAHTINQYIRNMVIIIRGYHKCLIAARCNRKRAYGVMETVPGDRLHQLKCGLEMTF